MAACVPRPLDRLLCATRVVALLHLNFAISSDNEPVAGASRQIFLVRPDDQEMIADQLMFDPMPVEERKKLRIVGLMDLNPSKFEVAVLLEGNGGGCSWLTPPTKTKQAPLQRALLCAAPPPTGAAPWE